MAVHKNNPNPPVGAPGEGAVWHGRLDEAVGLVRVGLDGLFLDANDRMCAITGYRLEELRRLTFMDITHPKDGQRVKDLLDKLMRGQVGFGTFGNRYVNKSGAIVWVRHTVTLQRDAKGVPLHCIGTVQAMGECHENQHAVESFNEADTARNAALHTLDAIGEAAALVDPDGYIEDFTPAFCQLCDYDFGALTRMDIRDIIEGLIHSSATHGIETRIVETVRTSTAEKKFDEVLPVKVKDGTTRWVVPHISSVLGKDGQLAGRLLVLRNVSGLKQAQMKSAESERKYRELVELANSSILRVDLDFSIQFVNEFAQNFFGYTADELVGSSLLDTLVPRLDPEGNDLHVDMREMAGAPELHGSYDQINLCKDGRRVWIHWSVRAIRNEQGEVRELLLVGTDIMKRKRAEIRAEHFRKRSRMLADQLIETEIRERSEMAAYLHDNIIQLLSLSNIRLGGLLPLLEEKGCDRDVDCLLGIRSLLSDAVEQCRSVMGRLVPAMLNDFGLGTALHHLAEKHRKLGGREIDVDDRLGEMKLASGLASILFRGARELLMNALKYAGASRIDISVWVEDGRIHLRVADNGRGFDTSRLEEPSYDQAGGFGLFDIRERLEGLNGELRIESRLGQGTVATVRIPCAAASSGIPTIKDGS